VINRSKKIGPFLACLALIGLVAGCGEKEEPATTGAVVTTQSTNETTTTTPSNEALPPGELASLFLTGKPPSIDLCSEGLTPRFLRQSYGGREGCLASRKPNALATVANLSPGTGNGAQVTIAARPKGGTYDGDKLTITMIRSGDSWLIDDLRSNAPVGP
jgi:hypothetical protein